MSLNTHSTNLVLASSQSWSITDAAQTGLDITGDMSLVFWVKLAQLPSVVAANIFLMAKDSAGVERSFAVRFDTSDRLRVDFWDSSQNNTRRTASGGLVAADVGNWVQYIITIDVSTPSILTYKNGKSFGGGTAITNATSIDNSTAPLYIAAADGGGSTVDGDMDEIRIYDRILTPAEIALTSFRYSQLDVYEPALKGYWRFNNNGLDQTTNNNDLTNNNVATFTVDVPFGEDQGEASLLLAI